MRILNIRSLYGPNYWSIYRKNLIQMELDIGIYEKLPTNLIAGFSDRLYKLIPTLYTHRCSVGKPGGFIQRMNEGTWFGHVIEHVALELQSLAGMECGFGRTRSTGQPGVYNVVFSYLIESAGVHAAKSSVNLVEAVANRKDYDVISEIEKLSKIYNSEKLSPRTQDIINEAQRRRIPCTRLNDQSLIMLGQGANHRILCASTANRTDDRCAPNLILSHGLLPCSKNTINLSTGGTADDVGDHAHLDTVVSTDKTVHLLNIDIDKVRITTTDTWRPITAKTGTVLEVNASPCFQGQQNPARVKLPNVGSSVIDMLYPNGLNSRIPITAVAGSRGKTMATKLLTHIAINCGLYAGCATTDGIFINKFLISPDNQNDSAGATLLLRNPLLNYAVLECGKEGLLNTGLGVDRCDISIVTNILRQDNGAIGRKHNRTLVRIKSIVTKSTIKNGYAILNADDDLVFNMKDDLSCNIALFSLNNESNRVREHRIGGGLVASINDGWLMLSRSETTSKVLQINQIPYLSDSNYEDVIYNVLAATLAAVISHFSIENIKIALTTFVETPDVKHGEF